jgi:hypothetical protein
VLGLPGARRLDTPGVGRDAAGYRAAMPTGEPAQPGPVEGGAMAAQTVAMVLLDHGVLVEQARERLAEALGDDARIGDVEAGTGFFDVTVEAPSFDAALDRVWDAVAAAGADDHLAFAEHPDLPEHWRRRSRPAREPA